MHLRIADYSNQSFGLRIIDVSHRNQLSLQPIVVENNVRFNRRMLHNMPERLDNTDSVICLDQPTLHKGYLQSDDPCKRYVSQPLSPATATAERELLIPKVAMRAL